MDVAQKSGRPMDKLVSIMEALLNKYVYLYSV
jgi:hypothetical protein